MLVWSVGAAALGLLATWVVTTRLTRREPPPGPMLYWALGLAALLPAWLIAFLGLMGGSPVGRPTIPLEIPFLLSSAAALLGVIVTDAVVRQLSDPARPHRPLTYWLLGVAALVPAWGVALAGLRETGR